MQNKKQTTVYRITECKDHLCYPFPEGYVFKRLIADPVLANSGDIYQPIYSKEDPEFFRNDWTVLAFRAIKTIKPLVSRRSSICIVGTGGGLDALGVIEILNPAKLSVTDLSEAALNQSHLNILRNLLPSVLKTIVLLKQKSFLFNTVDFAKNSFDFIYENLPNLPLEKGTKVFKCTQPVTASYYYNREIAGATVPKDYAERLLSLHWLFLVSAKPYLKPEGKVLCSIGGRVDYAIIEKMFNEAGYKAQLIVYDFKRQNESASNLPGYAAEERKRKELQKFRYYYYTEILDLLKRKKQNKLQGFAASPKSLQSVLHRKSISAQKAVEEYQSHGKQIGHEVYFILGRLMQT